MCLQLLVKLSTYLYNNIRVSFLGKDRDLQYDPSIPAHKGFMTLLNVICSIGTVNSEAHGRPLLALTPGYEHAIMQLLPGKEKVFEVLSAVLRARYFGSGRAYEGNEEDFPPKLCHQVAGARVIARGEVRILGQKIQLPTFAILPNGLVITANEPTAQAVINPWPCRP